MNTWRRPWNRGTFTPQHHQHLQCFFCFVFFYRKERQPCKAYQVILKYRNLLPLVPSVLKQNFKRPKSSSSWTYAVTWRMSAWVTNWKCFHITLGHFDYDVKLCDAIWAIIRMRSLLMLLHWCPSGHAGQITHYLHWWHLDLLPKWRNTHPIYLQYITNIFLCLLLLFELPSTFEIAELQLYRSSTMCSGTLSYRRTLWVNRECNSCPNYEWIHGKIVGLH